MKTINDTPFLRYENVCFGFLYFEVLYFWLIYHVWFNQQSPKISSFGFRGLAESSFSFFHSDQHKKVNDSIPGLEIFPNEYSSWSENWKGHILLNTVTERNFSHREVFKQIETTKIPIRYPF